MKHLYRRTPGIDERRVGSGLFLAHPGTGSVFRANPSFAALWTALAEPLTGEELLRLFRTAFPRVGARRMREEVQTMLNDLVEAGLVERVAPPV